MNIFRLIQIHLELECITFDHRGDLLRLACPEPNEIPRVYVGHHAQGYVTLFHHDLAPALREEINAVTPELTLQEPDRVRTILAREAPCAKIWDNKSYVFDKRISPDMFPNVTRIDHTRSGLFADASGLVAQPTFAIVQNGEIVSRCESSRENKHAAEAAVQTKEEYRGRGFARQTCLAWASDIQARNKIAFYSPKSEDTACQALAQSLGARQWITHIAFS